MPTIEDFIGRKLPRFLIDRIYKYTRYHQLETKFSHDFIPIPFPLSESYFINTLEWGCMRVSHDQASELVRISNKFIHAYLYQESLTVISLEPPFICKEVLPFQGIPSLDVVIEFITSVHEPPP